MAIDFKTKEQADKAMAELLQLSQYYQTRTDRKEAGVISSLSNLNDIITKAKTPEQIANASTALSNISGTNMSESTRLASQSINTALENKQFEINKYGDRIDQASAIFSDPNYLDKAEEWRDLESLRKSELYTNDDGTYKYESNTMMLGELYSEANALYEGIKNGIDNGYRYNKNADFDDDEVLTNITLYKNRIEKAIAALTGDGIITIQEASMIMGGMTKSEMKTELNRLAGLTGKEIKKQELIVQTYKEPAAAATFFQMKNEDGDPIVNPGDIPDLQDILTGQVSQETIDEADRELNILYKRYLELTGSSYQGVTDVPATDTEELREAAEGFIDENNDGFPDLVQAPSDITTEKIEDTAKPSVTSDMTVEEFDIKKQEEQKKLRDEARGVDVPKVKGIGVTEIGTGARERAQQFNVHPSLQAEVDKWQPNGFGYPERTDNRPFSSQRDWQLQIMDKSNRLKERDKILDGSDKAVPAMNEFLEGKLNMNQAMTKGKYSDSDRTEIVGQASRKKLKAYQNKYQKWKKTALKRKEIFGEKDFDVSIEAFIKQNPEEYYEMTKILKYGDYWLKNPRKIGKSKHYINLYD